MSYLNGRDVFPPKLLEEIQRYAQGTCVYIPRLGEKQRRPSALRERNAEICLRYAEGEPVRLLAEEYYLSPQAIYRILSRSRR